MRSNAWLSSLQHPPRCLPRFEPRKPPFRSWILEHTATSNTSEVSRMLRRCVATGLTLQCKQKSQKRRSLSLRKRLKLTSAASGLT